MSVLMYYRGLLNCRMEAAAGCLSGRGQAARQLGKGPSLMTSGGLALRVTSVIWERGERPP